eukprot:SAG31_NODE_403_length_16150_cov_12.566588_17_plen_110_part_00
MAYQPFGASEGIKFNPFGRADTFRAYSFTIHMSEQQRGSGSSFFGIRTDDIFNMMIRFKASPRAPMVMGLRGGGSDGRGGDDSFGGDGFESSSCTSDVKIRSTSFRSLI